MQDFFKVCVLKFGVFSRNIQIPLKIHTPFSGTFHFSLFKIICCFRCRELLRSYQRQIPVVTLTMNPLTVPLQQYIKPRACRASELLLCCTLWLLRTFMSSWEVIVIRDFLLTAQEVIFWFYAGQCQTCSQLQNSALLPAPLHCCALLLYFHAMGRTGGGSGEHIAILWPRGYTAHQVLTQDLIVQRRPNT